MLMSICPLIIGLIVGFNGELDKAIGLFCIFALLLIVDRLNMILFQLKSWNKLVQNVASLLVALGVKANEDKLKDNVKEYQHDI